VKDSSAQFDQAANRKKVVAPMKVAVPGGSNLSANDKKLLTNNWMSERERTLRVQSIRLAVVALKRGNKTMNNQLKFGLVCAFVLASVNTAMAGEPGQIVIRQASNSALVTHPVAGDINLFAAYIQPASYAYGGGEQFNVDIRYNMDGAPWADSYAINCSDASPPCNVGTGVEWTTNDEIHIVKASQVPILLRFDVAYGSQYVLVVDRAITDIAVKVAGDVDGNGVLTNEDAILVAEATVGVSHLSRIESAVADVNCDNTVDIVDALTIARTAAGMDVLGCQ
jgi:hypothetical protein